MDRRREAKAREGEVKEDEWRVTVNPIFIESSVDDKQRVCPASRQRPVHLINPTEVRWEGRSESERASKRARQRLSVTPLTAGAGHTRGNYLEYVTYIIPPN